MMHLFTESFTLKLFDDIHNIQFVLFSFLTRKYLTYLGQLFHSNFHSVNVHLDIITSFIYATE